MSFNIHAESMLFEQPVKLIPGIVFVIIHSKPVHIWEAEAEPIQHLPTHQISSFYPSPLVWKKICSMMTKPVCGRWLGQPVLQSDAMKQGFPVNAVETTKMLDRAKEIHYSYRLFHCASCWPAIHRSSFDGLSTWSNPNTGLFVWLFDVFDLDERIGNYAINRRWLVLDFNF